MALDVYRILYCSRNVVNSSSGTEEQEIAQILAKSRVNNSKNGITGALLFNSGFFAQVLEGPLDAVDQTFERIQRDMRHDEIIVLECGNVPVRDFPEWSMAYAATEGGDTSRFAEMSLAKLLEHQSTAAEAVGGLLRSLVLQDEGVPA